MVCTIFKVLSVINDRAERGVALVQEFNGKPTNEEGLEQFT